MYLLSVFASCFISVWSVYCTSNGQWVASKILQGFLGAPIESLCEITVSDIYFEHERAKGMGIYALALLTSNTVAPMIAGFIADGMNWKWVLFFGSIFDAACFVFLFFFMEETNYTRRVNAKSTKITTLEGIVSNEKNAGVTVTSKEKLIEPILSHQTIEERIQETNENLYNEVDIVSTEEEVPAVKPRKSWISKLSLTGGIKKKFLLGHYFWGPVLMCRYPAVLWSGFLYGSTVVGFNLINATESAVLYYPPYNFSSAMCGLAYGGPLVGQLICFAINSFITDKLKITIARKRNSLSIPEDRFHVLIFAAVLGLGGTLMWSLGAYYKQPWPLLVIGLGVSGGLGIFTCTIATLYVSDTYKELDTEGMVVVIVIRNCMSFACSYGLTPWVTNMGIKNAFLCSGLILFG